MLRIVALTLLTLFFNLASAAVTQPQTKWANHEIPVRVCWGNWNLDFEKFNQKKKDAVLTTKRFDLEKSKLTEFSQETKLLVQTIVNQEFTPQRTIIHFVGWQTCENDPLAVVGIFPAVPIKEKGAFTIGSSSVGKNSLYYIKTKKGLIEAPVGKRVWVKKIVMKTDSDLGLNVITFDPSVVDEIKMRKDGYFPLKGRSTVLHEFGHVAGLDHELATLSRADYRKDRYCKPLLKQDRDFYELEITGSMKRVSVFDPVSIMNYCWLDRATELMTGSYETLIQPKHDYKDKTLCLHAWDLAYEKLTPKSDCHFDRIDPTIFLESKIPGKDDMIRVDIHMGLSQSDVHGLKCLYDESYASEETCNKDFDPRSQ